MVGEVVPELKVFVLSGSCSQLKQSIVTWLKENTVGGKISCLFVVYCNNHRKIIVCVTLCCHGKRWKCFCLNVLTFFLLCETLTLIFVMVTEFPNALRVLALSQVLQDWFLCITFNCIKYRIQLILLKAISWSPINKASFMVAFLSKLM